MSYKVISTFIFLFFFCCFVKDYVNNDGIDTIDLKIKSMKDEIDVRIESIKSELDKINDKFKHELELIREELVR